MKIPRNWQFDGALGAVRRRVDGIFQTKVIFRRVPAGRGLAGIGRNSVAALTGFGGTRHTLSTSHARTVPQHGMRLPV